MRRIKIPSLSAAHIVVALTFHWLRGLPVIADRTHEFVGRWTRWHIQSSKTDGRIGVDWHTVKALGLMISQAFLLRACEVIE